MEGRNEFETVSEIEISLKDGSISGWMVFGGGKNDWIGIGLMVNYAEVNFEYGTLDETKWNR